MRDYEVALIYGTLSASTLPIGAICGIYFTLSQSTIANSIAFGAGALLFAVTVELYGSAIDRLEEEHYNQYNVLEVLTTAVGAVAGSLIYISLCRWLDQTLEDLDTKGGLMGDSAINSVTNSPLLKPQAGPGVPSINIMPPSPRFQGGEAPWFPTAASPESASPPARPGSALGDDVGDTERGRLSVPLGASPEPRALSQSAWASEPPRLDIAEARSRGRRRDDDDYDQDRLPSTRGRKRAVLGVLHPELIKKAQDSNRLRSASPMPLPGDLSYGTCDASMSPPGSDRDLDLRQEIHAKEQRNCELDAERLNDLRIAAGIWLGVLLDGIPEAIMLGYLAAEYKLSFALVAALLIANFPESFSSSALLHRRGVEGWKIVAMWTFLCMFTGVVACLTAYNLPRHLMTEQGEYRDRYLYHKFFGALVEGMAGGAMLACISNIMLPEAFKHRGDMAGIFVLFGFLVATMIKVFCGVIQEQVEDSDYMATTAFVHRGGRAASAFKFK